MDLLAVNTLPKTCSSCLFREWVMIYGKTTENLIFYMLQNKNIGNSVLKDIKSRSGEKINDHEQALYELAITSISQYFKCYQMLNIYFKIKI